MDDPQSERVPLEDVVLAGKLQCPLEEAALRMARQEYPELGLEPSLIELDAFAEHVRPLVSAKAPAPEIIGATSDVLFRQLGFRVPSYVIGSLGMRVAGSASRTRP